MALNFKQKQNTGDVELDANSLFLKDAKYDMLFLHPEAFQTCMDGKELLQSVPYQRFVKTIVIDEAHCILELSEPDLLHYTLRGSILQCFVKAYMK